MIKKKEFSQKDKKVWEDYIKDPSDIYDKEKNISNNTQRRERYKFDLHGFTLDEANNKVKEIIENCVKNKDLNPAVLHLSIKLSVKPWSL